jgi:hypothetical protein
VLWVLWVKGKKVMRMRLVKGSSLGGKTYRKGM